jgi:hypothetical protein
MIMLIDLLACWNGPLGLPVSSRGGRVALLATILRLVVVTSPVVAAVVVLAATSDVATIVVVAT